MLVKKLLFIVVSFYLILESNLLYAQKKSSSTVTVRMDLRKFKTNSSDVEIKQTFTPEGEIIRTTSYVDLSLEILPESYAFENEPIVYNDKGLQTKVINGGEEILMKFKLSNNGTGFAENIRYNLTFKSVNSNQPVSNRFSLDVLDGPSTLGPGKDAVFSTLIKADKNLRPSRTRFTLSVDDATKAGDNKTSRPIETDFIKRPNIEIKTSILGTAKDLKFSENLDSKVEAKDFVKLRVTIENNGDGPAKGLSINFLEDEHYRRFRPAGYFNSSVLEIDKLDARTSTEETLIYRINQTDDFSVLANSSGIEYRVLIEEELTGENYLSDYFAVFSPELETQNVLEASYTEVVEESFDEKFISYDDHIYQTELQANNFGLIISNSTYSRMSKIPSARSDALLMEKYFNKAFGVPYENIVNRQDLSGGAFRDVIDLDMKNKLIGKNNVKLFVYYAGHGMLDDKNNGLFLPTDVNPVSPNLAYNSVNQSDFYEKLYNLDNVDKIYVFVDACFSGEPKSRDKTYLNEDVERKFLSQRGSERGSNYSLKDEFKEKINLFSAASKNQTSLSYEYFQKNSDFNIDNGLFTTFLAAALLKNEKGIVNSDSNRDGSISIGELYNYIDNKVNTFSNGTQSPTWSGKDREENIIN